MFLPLWFHYSHFTADKSLSISACGWQVQPREKGRGQAGLPPTCNTCSASSSQHSLTCESTCRRGFRASPGSLEWLSAGPPLGLSAGSHLLPCLGALGRSCHVALVTFPRGPCLPPPAPETRLDFTQHHCHLWSLVERALQTLARPAPARFPVSQPGRRSFPATVWLLFRAPSPAPPCEEAAARFCSPCGLRFRGAVLWASRLPGSLPSGAGLGLGGANKGLGSLQRAGACSGGGPSRPPAGAAVLPAPPVPSAAAEGSNQAVALSRPLTRPASARSSPSGVSLCGSQTGVAAAPEGQQAVGAPGSEKVPSAARPDEGGLIYLLVFFLICWFLKE